MHAQWTPGVGESARWWLVQWRTSTAWNAKVVWGAERALDIPFSGSADRADVVAVTALDASMNASPVAIWRAPNEPAVTALPDCGRAPIRWIRAP
jgi:hypothetical protein